MGKTSSALAVLKVVFLPWLRVAELRVEAHWLLEGWNRACVISDDIRDSLERAHDRNRELADELVVLREAVRSQDGTPGENDQSRDEPILPLPTSPLGEG